MSAPSIQRTLNISEAAIKAAKPFPSPYSPGHDICQITRIAALLQSEKSRNRWARRIFTRLEWPGIVSRFQQAARAEGGSEQQQITAPGERSEDRKASIWALPKLSKFNTLLKSPDQCRAAIVDQLSPLGSLARHLAGRWAAKEAIIKAHSHRRLYMHDISICSAAGHGKPFALIEPVCDTVEMDEDVAALRGLRGFGCRSLGLHKTALMTKLETKNGIQEEDKREIENLRKLIRHAKVNPSDRQIAEISISHDGDLASAVCVAFDPPILQHAERKLIADDGEGPPMHEPQWGDEGWLEKENTK